MSHGCDVAKPRKAHKYERSTLAERSDTTKAKTAGQQIALDLRRTILHFFPDLFARLEAVVDPRTRHDYTMTEILLGGIFMFSVKQGSRNEMNLDRSKGDFAANFERLFGKCLPHMDTIDDVLRALEDGELERLKAALVASLIEKKVFGKSRLLGRLNRVAVDATGVFSVPEGHCDHCLRRESSTGTVSFFHNVLEAKLITPNGFAISLATEWIENTEVYLKQDCELKAFRRLAEKLKTYFPRLPICIHADGLYPNKPFFDLCRDKDWNFIVTLKDASLKTLWDDIEMELLTSMNERRVVKAGNEQAYRWLCQLVYQGVELSWIECCETKGGKTTRFVHVTDLTADADNVVELAESGRMRFMIENEGFNTLKHQGYALEHKYSRTSYTAAKNYMSLMHIAHLLNQLYERSQLFRPLLVAKMTVKHLWKELVSALSGTVIDASGLAPADMDRFQIRFG